MLEEIHELLGFAALTLGAVTAALGALVYQFKHLRSHLPGARPRWVALHRGAAVAFVALVPIHYATAPVSHPLQLLGAALAGTVFLLGWVLRYRKQWYRSLVWSKAALVAVAAVALYLGHQWVEHAPGSGHGEDSGYGEHYDDD